jgi:hypothetical protein
MSGQPVQVPGDARLPMAPKERVLGKGGEQMADGRWQFSDNSCGTGSKCPAGVLAISTCGAGGAAGTQVGDAENHGKAYGDNDNGGCVLQDQ